MKLNIGAGETRLEGFEPVDRRLGSEAYPLAYESDSVEEIRASHILEHFKRSETDRVLADWFRVLEPGGRIRIAVPDFDKILAMRAVTDNGHEDDGFDRAVARRWQDYLFGGQVDENDQHHVAFTESSLRAALDRCGFEEIGPWEDEQAVDTASHSVSLRLEARKPMAVKQDPIGTVNMCAVMSVPRLGWNDAWSAAVHALSPFKMPIRSYTGAFWEQGIQNALEQCIEDGIDWVATIDYDSLFTSWHLDRLIGHLGENPEIDAIAAVQARRGKPYPLMTKKGTTKLELTGQPVQVDTAHFGLTLIRLSELKDIPKPWFQGKAAEDGTWTHYSRFDPDIWFWHQWRLAGKTLYVAPDVRIGHLEVMVSEYDEEMNQRHVYVKDWHAQHNTGAMQEFDE